jgi:hypothetical protein
MKSGNMRDLLPAAQWEVQVINVKMNEIEIPFFAEDLVEHQHMMS